MSFATPDDLAGYLNITFAVGAETVQAQAVLDAATDEMTKFMGQPIVTPAATETVTLDANNAFVLLLPRRPVLSVNSVTNDGSVLTVATDVFWYDDGRLYLQDGGRWGCKRQSVVVNYTHGYDSLPVELKDICVQVAARKLANPTDMKTEAVGSYRGEYSQGFTDAEETVLLDIGGVTIA